MMEHMEVRGLAGFHKEIAALKNGENAEPSLFPVNAEELTEEDRELYESFKGGTLTEEALMKHQEQFVDEEPGNYSSRFNFSAFIANKMAIKKLQAEVERRKKDN